MTWFITSAVKILKTDDLASKMWCYNQTYTEIARQLVGVILAGDRLRTHSLQKNPAVIGNSPTESGIIFAIVTIKKVVTIDHFMWYTHKGSPDDQLTFIHSSHCPPTRQQHSIRWPSHLVRFHSGQQVITEVTGASPTNCIQAQ